MERPIIGFICEDISAGARFYHEFEESMAKLWPDETQRPIVYAEFGLNHFEKPEIVTAEKCDYIFQISLKKHHHHHVTENAAQLINTLLHQSYSTIAPGEIKPVFSRLEAYSQAENAELSLRRKIYVIAGMGPIAGANFLQSLDKELQTAGVSDKTTIKLYSNPQMPGKYAADNILDDLAHDIDYLVKFREFVNHSNDILVAPCNTFHTNISYFGLVTKINKKILHIVKQVETTMFGLECKTIAVMGTKRTVNKELYEDVFKGSGKEIFTLKHYPKYKKMVQEGINWVKSGDALTGGKKFKEVISFIKIVSPNSPIILGCTEIVIGCRAVGIEIKHPLYDSVDILAHATAQQIVITPVVHIEDIFNAQRDLTQFLSFALLKLQHYQFEKHDKKVESVCLKLITKISGLLHGEHNKEDYLALLFEMIAEQDQHHNSPHFRKALGEIIHHELAVNPRDIPDTIVKEYRQKIADAQEMHRSEFEEGHFMLK